MNAVKEETIAGEKVPVEIVPEKKARKPRSDAGKPRGPRLAVVTPKKPAKKASKKSKKATRYNTARRRLLVVEAVASGYPDAYRADVRASLDSGPQPYRILGGAIAGVVRHEYRKAAELLHSQPWLVIAGIVAAACAGYLVG